MAEARMLVPVLASLRVITVLLVGVVACNSTPRSPSPEELPRSEPAGSEPKLIAAGPRARSGNPGAYFLVEGVGLVMLDDGGFHVVEASSDSVILQGLRLGPGGAVYTHRSTFSPSVDTLSRLEGEQLVPATKTVASEMILDESFAVAPDGTAALVRTKGVSRWDGDAWKLASWDTIGVKDGYFSKLAFDGNGVLWVAFADQVRRRDGETWRAVDLGKARTGELSVRDIQAGPDGSIHVLEAAALRKIDAASGAITTIDVGAGDSPDLRLLRVAPGGGIAVVGSYTDTYHVPAGGPPRKYTAVGSRDFTADYVTVVVPDDRGRLWVGSDFGLAVLTPDAPRVEWLSGSTPELIGVIRAMVVIGGGPERLPTPAPQARGGVRGSITKAGAPVKGSAVELCPTPHTEFTTAPCDEASIKFTTRTDNDGVWTLQDVPLGDYALTVKDADTWRIEVGDMTEGMKAGAVHDAGTWDLPAD